MTAELQTHSVDTARRRSLRLTGGVEHGVQMVSPTDALPTLTAQARTALSLSATGLVAAEVADAMGQTPEAVRRLLASSIKRLGAHSKLEAVLIAARAGQLDSSV
jgi:DNA-binding CsgD family transcriptional regulator